MNGILCVNKPADFTSFDVIAKLRGMLKIRRIGHSGTLDPMATGVLPVFVGNATKACDIIPNTDKIYRAGFRFGCTSDTQDVWGNILTQSSKSVTEEELLAVIPEFTGKIMQLPPMYSAVKINGQKLYDLARKGVEIERTPRETEIYSLKVEAYDEAAREGILYIACSKGTYVRTIISDIGERLGCGGIMTSLVRISACGFTLDDCFTLEEIQQACDKNKPELVMLATELIFDGLPKLELNDVQTRMYKNGVKLDLSKLIGITEGCTEYTVYGSDGKFIGTAIADHESGILRVGKNLA